MRAVLLLLASLLISSCASINVIPPEKSDYEVSRTYALSFEDTWAYAADWFAEQNVTIDLLEKPSGLITVSTLMFLKDF